jgi:phosphatidylglycerophosphatase C
VTRKSASTLAAFDFDRTLTQHGTFTPFLMFAARAEPWRFLLLIPGGALGLLHLAGVLTRKRLKEIMMGFFLGGKSRAELDRLSKAFAGRLLARGVHKAALDAIRDHQRQGHKVGLATASLDLYIRFVTEALKLDFEISTRIAFHGGRLAAPRIEGENCYGEAKAARLAKLLAKEKPREVWFYSDHPSDLPSFALAGVKVAVNPGPNLAAKAKGAGWRVAWWD